MRNSRLLLLFSVLNFVGVLVFIFKLPEDIVFKFNNQLIADQTIGRWFFLFLAGVSIVASLIIFIVDIVEKGRVIHVYRYLVAFLAICVCFYYIWIMMGVQYHGIKIGDKIDLPVTLMILIPLSYAMFANSMFKYNKKLGEGSIFNYSWTRENPVIWLKTHRFAGIVSSIVGLIILVLALINEFVVCISYIYIYIIVAWLVIYYIFTLIYSKLTNA